MDSGESAGLSGDRACCVQQEGISSYAGRRGVYCAGGKTLQFVRILADLQGGGEARADYSGTDIMAGCLAAAGLPLNNVAFYSPLPAILQHRGE